MKKKIVRMLLCFLTLFALAAAGCGEKTDGADIREETDASGNPGENGGGEINGAEGANDGAVAADNPKNEEENGGGTAEELYWQEMLKEFADSEYDLTAALMEPALKDLCGGYFTLGVGINGSSLENQTLNMPEYMAVAKKHFNSCTMTNLMKSAYILDQKGSAENAAKGDESPALSFDTIDPTLEWCMENGMQMRGHTLIWHAQAPGWFFREGYTDKGDFVDRETMLFRMESYIAQLMTHVQDSYPGVVYCWDVVNEAVDPDRGDQNSAFLCRTENDGEPNPWYVTIGEDYVEMAFTYARRYAADGVKLFYNDFNTYQEKKRDAIYTLCESLKEKGLIDGIGMQGYWGLDYPSIGTLELTVTRFAELGLEIHITELSVGVDEETEENFARQGSRYGSVFMSLKGLDTEGGGKANITNVTFFGLIDHYRPGDTTNSRLFDENYQPKPAFERVRDMMRAVYK
ncbi:MAG: endo-1,4-beta-xylanase [bacterium]|nr:endo-1,4-beta-xylanase [bacterium]